MAFNINYLQAPDLKTDYGKAGFGGALQSAGNMMKDTAAFSVKKSKADTINRYHDALIDNFNETKKARIAEQEKQRRTESAAVGLFRKNYPEQTKNLSDDEVLYLGDNMDKFFKKNGSQLSKLSTYTDENGNHKVTYQDENGKVGELTFGKVMPKGSGKSADKTPFGMVEVRRAVVTNALDNMNNPIDRKIFRENYYCDDKTGKCYINKDFLENKKLMKTDKDFNKQF